VAYYAPSGKRYASVPNIQSDLSEIYTRLYTNFLKSFIYDDVGFEVRTKFSTLRVFHLDQQNNATELTLGTILNEHSAIVRHGDENLEAEHAEESADMITHGSYIFREDEILVYGMPDRRRQASHYIMPNTLNCKSTVSSYLLLLLNDYERKLMRPCGPSQSFSIQGILKKTRAHTIRRFLGYQTIYKAKWVTSLPCSLNYKPCLFDQGNS